MLGKKQLQFGLIISMILVISLLASIIYLWFIKVPELNKNISQLNSKLETVVSDVKNKDDANKSLQAELTGVNKSKTDLENRVKSNEVALSKQQSCTKANELSQVPGDLVIRGGDTNVCNPSGTNLPSSTQGVLDYLHGLVKNYKDTGLWTWHQIPEPCQADAEKAIPILEKRFADYQNYKNICSN